MAKWKEMKMETPRDRLKKRREAELKKKQELEVQRKKDLKFKILGVAGLILFFVIVTAGFFSYKAGVEKELELEKASSLKVIKNIGDIVYERKEYSSDDTENMFKEGDVLFLDDNGKARLDCQNESVFTIKNGLEIKLVSIKAISEKKLDLVFEAKNGDIICKKVANNGSIEINTDFGSLSADSTKKVIFKLETKDFGNSLRIVVRDGEVGFKAKGETSKMLVRKGKQVLLKNNGSSIETGKIKDVNVIAESWD